MSMTRRLVHCPVKYSSLLTIQYSLSILESTQSARTLLL